MKKILFASFFSVFTILSQAQATMEAGIEQMENENYTAALNTFNTLCKADPKNCLAYYYIGEVQYKMEDYTEAEKSFKKGITANTQCAECYVGLGKLQLDNRDTLGAGKNFATAMRINKKNPAIYGFIGDTYLYSKYPDAENAIKYLEQAKGMDPKVATFWAHLGEAFQMAGDNGAAMTSYETAVEKDPTNTEAYISMARIWSAAKQYDLAIPKLEKAMELAPNDARPIKDLYELYITTGKYSKVTPLLEKYVTLIGTDVDAKVRLVKFLTFQAKDYAKAIEEGEKVLNSNPDQYTLHRWLAWSYGETEKYQQSYDHSNSLFDALAKDETRKAFPTDYEYWAKAAFKLGKLEEAAHIYRKYLEFEPSKAAEIYATLAKAYYDSTNYVQAVTYYHRKAVEKPLTNSEQYYLAYSYYFQDSLKQADSAFARVVELTPNFAQGWYMRARIADAIDSLKTEFLADTFYTRFIEVAEIERAKDPVNDKNKDKLIQAYYYKAYYWVQHDDIAMAKEYYLKMLELDPENAQALADLDLLKGQRR